MSRVFGYSQDSPSPAAACIPYVHMMVHTRENTVADPGGVMHT